MGEAVSIPRELFDDIESLLHALVAGFEDEGDRVYLESTNQADAVRELSQRVSFLMYETREAERG